MCSLRRWPVPAEQRFYGRLVRDLPTRPICCFDRFYCLHAVRAWLLHHGHGRQRVHRMQCRPVPSQHGVYELRLVHRWHLQCHVWRNFGERLRKLQREHLLERRRKCMLRLPVGQDGRLRVKLLFDRRMWRWVLC